MRKKSKKQKLSAKEILMIIGLSLSSYLSVVFLIFVIGALIEGKSEQAISYGLSSLLFAVPLFIMLKNAKKRNAVLMSGASPKLAPNPGASGGSGGHPGAAHAEAPKPDEARKIQKVCAHCGHVYAPDDVFCTECGSFETVLR